MNKEKAIVLDFTNVEVETQIDSFEKMDISKTVGNCVRMGTNDIGLDDWCREVYHKGKAETPVDWLPILKNIVRSTQTPLTIAAKQAVIKLIDEALSAS